jgi:hypothetical protein
MPRKSAYKPSMKAVRKVEMEIKNKEENIDFSALVPMDNSFATKMFADIKEKQPELFKQFYKVEPDGQTSFATLDDEGNTGLHQAAMGAMPNDESLFLATLQGIKDKNPRNNEGVTPLHIAAIRGKLRICELIIANVKDKNPPEETGQTPLHLAALEGHLAVCRLIIKILPTKKGILHSMLPLNEVIWIFAS